MGKSRVGDGVAKGIRVLSRRHLECYLLDDEILRKLCEKHGMPDKIDAVIDIKHQAILVAVNRGRDLSDIKSAAGQMIEGICKELSLQRAGNNTSTFMRDTIAPLITPDTAIYSLLKQDIFG